MVIKKDRTKNIISSYFFCSCWIRDRWKNIRIQDKLPGSATLTVYPVLVYSALDPYSRTERINTEQISTGTDN